MRDIVEINADARIENDEIKRAISSGDSDVQKFYEDAVVFVTGGSGFLGKQLIEKLIRSCAIRKIYVLLRSKKNKTIKERLKVILEDPVYEDLFKEQPNFVDKIVPIEGNTEELKLGIDEMNWKTLTEEVNIIFHAAATVNFKESVKIATLTNIRGAREILDLAKTCKHLKSLVHLSTAFSHATKSRVGKEVEEDFYECPISPEILIELAETKDNETLNAMMAPLMKDWPNSYTFTKAVGEELIRVQGKGLPICIVRPAIVISAYREPCPGWVDPKNAFGPSGLVLGIALGVLHIMLARNDNNLEFVPVDIVNNVTIVAAYETGKRYDSGKLKINIYAVTRFRNPFEINVLHQTLGNEARNLASIKAVWYCFGIVTSNKYAYRFLSWVFHFIPAMIVDGICLFFGHKPRFFDTFRKADSMSHVFEHFLNNEWMFKDANTIRMYESLSLTDKLIYNCDVVTVDGKELTYIWGYGVVRFIIKDDFKRRKEAQIKQTLLKVLHFIVSPLYFYSLFKLALLVFRLVLSVRKVTYFNT